jgi:hypothetical protein
MLYGNGAANLNFARELLIGCSIDVVDNVITLLMYRWFFSTICYLSHICLPAGVRYPYSRCPIHSEFGYWKTITINIMAHAE